MEALTKILSIAAGGALGAVARYLINISPFGARFGKFPFATFFINVSGSFLIGFLLIVSTDKYAVPENLRLAVLIGFLGAFTTFSTFELEIYELLKEGAFATAALYFALSVAVGFAGVAAGVALAKRF